MNLSKSDSLQYGLSQSSDDVRLIAFYLPQYHPIKENNEWWGKGFTEWTNVARARPRFRGHYQPHLPADLGFYDLRLPESRVAQAELASEYGVYGFCYYHYWFGGRRLLERPFYEVLSSGEPNFPFCLCWANENWTRTWDGTEEEVLMAQRYSAEDDVDHIRSLAPAFLDPRYIRVAGRPLFLVYRATKLPDSQATTDRWREEALKLGVGELFLCRVESFSETGDPRLLGFDAAVDFQPRQGVLRNFTRQTRFWAWARRFRLLEKGYLENYVFDYEEYVEWLIQEPPPSYPRYPGSCPSWDNSSRRVGRRALIFTNSTPETYKRGLISSIRKAPSIAGDTPIVFINAWNEWAEGNHLEPDQKWGRAYLEATREALELASPVKTLAVPIGKKE